MIPPGAFGWSYPPGCSGPPDMEEGPCDTCGKDLGRCICEECPECGECGRPDCYKPADAGGCGMIETPEQIASLAAAEREWAEANAAQAEAEARLAKMEANEPNLIDR